MARITIQTKLPRQGGEAWKDILAAELNDMLERANHVSENPNPRNITGDLKFISSTLSVVERVMEFEEIHTAEELRR